MSEKLAIYTWDPMPDTPQGVYAMAWTDSGDPRNHDRSDASQIVRNIEQQLRDVPSEHRVILIRSCGFRGVGVYDARKRESIAAGVTSLIEFGGHSKVGSMERDNERGSYPPQLWTCWDINGKPMPKLRGFADGIREAYE